MLNNAFYTFLFKIGSSVLFCIFAFSEKGNVFYYT